MAYDPVASFFDSLHAVKDAISPIETSIQRVVKDFECYCLGHGNLVKHFESFPHAQIMETSCKLGKIVHFTSILPVGIRGFPILFSFRNAELLDIIAKNDAKRDSSQRKHKKESIVGEIGLGVIYLQFLAAWSCFLGGLIHAFPVLIKPTKRICQEQCKDVCQEEFSPYLSENLKKRQQWNNISGVEAKKEGNFLSPDLFVGYLFNQLVHTLQKGDQSILQSSKQSCVTACSNSPTQSSQPEMIGLDPNYFLTNARFARVGGPSPSLEGIINSNVEPLDQDSNDKKEELELESSSQHKFANGLLNIPLSNVERLKSTFSNVSLAELMELAQLKSILSTVSLGELIEVVSHLGRSSKEYPDKKKLFSVQDFFRYTESEGRRFFEELDRDGDGQVTLEDLEFAMKKRRLPPRYAREFLRRTRSQLFSRSFGWKQFLSLMEQKEPKILKAYTTMCLSKSGTLKKGQVLTSLKNAGLPANEDNAITMMRFLNSDIEGSISYGHFRNFMLLLPFDRLEEDPRSIWFEAATVVSVPPPVEIPTESVLKAALAGGLASALSTSLLHPIDSMKTRVQASTLSFPELISNLPQIGLQGLYRGSIPAILGQFSSHGLRTGIFEASKLVLIKFAPTLPEMQVQTLASFCSTILGTAVRIPCEVMKQRLQAGIFDNVGEAFVSTLRQDGLKGFFRGTGATLCREVPFYVAGMGLYAKAKKEAQRLLRRELEPWETILVGALSGGLAAVITTPFDVLKTRTMTAPQGLPVSMQMIALSILQHEGPLGLFKGAVPRFFWIAPLGAMNFAGYELAKKAMTKSEDAAEY